MARLYLRKLGGLWLPWVWVGNCLLLL